MTTITTKSDLRQWVRQATANWDDRSDEYVDVIADAIQLWPDRPAWGADWSAFLESLPDLTEFVQDADLID